MNFSVQRHRCCELYEQWLFIYCVVFFLFISRWCFGFVFCFICIFFFFLFPFRFFFISLRWARAINTANIAFFFWSLAKLYVWCSWCSAVFWFDQVREKKKPLKDVPMQVHGLHKPCSDQFTLNSEQYQLANLIDRQTVRTLIRTIEILIKRLQNIFKTLWYEKNVRLSIILIRIIKNYIWRNRKRNNKE